MSNVSFFKVRFAILFVPFGPRLTRVDLHKACVREPSPSILSHKIFVGVYLLFMRGEQFSHMY